MRAELQGCESQTPKRNPGLQIVIGLAVLVLGLVGFAGFMARRDFRAHAVSVTFLGYRKGYISGFESQYRWGLFRITNGSRVTLNCQRMEIEVERGGSWSHESPISLGPSYERSVLQPGESINIAIVAPSTGTRWRNNFLFTPMPRINAITWKDK